MNLARADLRRLLGDSAGHRFEVTKFEMVSSLVSFGITVSNSPIRSRDLTPQKTPLISGARERTI